MRPRILANAATNGSSVGLLARLSISTILSRSRAEASKAYLMQVHRLWCQSAQACSNSHGTAARGGSSGLIRAIRIMAELHSGPHHPCKMFEHTALPPYHIIPYHKFTIMDEGKDRVQHWLFDP
ncbi:hypothetical protein BO71DRAFT_160866 [Aspergillus ellipticus CBS 707.79]|uniref:Uncharacterized protein n=1 Tax=Aspergillus ellipticus CBS 707.79 TaxID=1448320 RepID=A0A319DH83_9EURO|nr:hypothetical protein BO71DRAFT_160866 [Aspergillus ellipticus CBS 707.79]